MLWTYISIEEEKMERVFSPDDRIRRAEEIYARRQNLRERTKRATVNVSEPKNFKLFRKLALKIAICVLIYFIFYLINTTNYTFSENILIKTKEVISNDVDFYGIYNSVLKYVNDFIYSDINIEQSNEETTAKGEQIDGENTSGEQASESGEKNENNEEESLTQSEISQAEESETDRIRKTYSFVLPVTGTVSSEYGTREVTSSVVTAYHKGIDIGADIGTPIYASTDGEVIISRNSPSYGKYVMIQNNEVKTVYAHCSELLVGVRRNCI